MASRFTRIIDAVIGAGIAEGIIKAFTDAAKGVGEEGAHIIADRIQRSVADRRNEIGELLREMEEMGGDYEVAARNLFEGQYLRQTEAERLYGAGERYLPGDENKYMNHLSLFYGVFDPPPRPEKPETPSGGQQRLETTAYLYYEWHNELRNRNRAANSLRKARIEFFKWLGLMDHEQRDAFLEAVNDDAFKQWLRRVLLSARRAGESLAEADRSIADRIRAFSRRHGLTT